MVMLIAHISFDESLSRGNRVFVGVPFVPPQRQVGEGRAALGQATNR
jgi:hypothetical protein